MLRGFYFLLSFLREPAPLPVACSGTTFLWADSASAETI